VYIASIRASARVLRLVPHANGSLSLVHLNIEDEDIDDDDVFGLGESLDREEQEEKDSKGVIFGTDGITDVSVFSEPPDPGSNVSCVVRR